MKTYIALLRGINVSGQKIIKMELLRNAMAELDFENVTTYIQSGNIIFESIEDNINLLENQINSKINEHFGFDVPVVIVTIDYLKSVVNKNPFANRELHDSAQPYVAFLSEQPNTENSVVLNSIDFGNDELLISNKSVYLHYANGAGKTKLSNAIIENKLKVKSTMRNWKTVLKLIDLTEKL